VKVDLTAFEAIPRDRLIKLAAMSPAEQCASSDRKLKRAIGRFLRENPQLLAKSYPRMSWPEKVARFWAIVNLLTQQPQVKEAAGVGRFLAEVEADPEGFSAFIQEKASELESAGRAIEQLRQAPAAGVKRQLADMVRERFGPDMEVVG